MLNHLSLASQLKSSTFNKALDIYHGDVKKFISSNQTAKEYLVHLNMFLYTYFLVEYNKDLEVFALQNERYIYSENNIHVLIELGEIILKGYTNKFSSELNQNDHELIEKALDYINKNYNKKITLQTVANKLHISRNYLCHLFKTKTGYKFCEYINLQRVNKAKTLIEENKKTFEFISFDCGFSSQSHFSTTFKKYMGLTPNEYKKELG
ncbi:helix-turn-helix domain-containing protein [Peptoniphilus mikwangii]|uniref:helix-turn-helix domain-containing protein n=1 Tax=Peptoniphilus mikwangii TaxID=1354300 RepID=UPI00041074C0|nr:AraC family transcriptional regulator [Peptoniphilus mikwangii]